MANSRKKTSPENKREKIELDTRGQLTVPLDADYTLRPSYDAIEEAEIETGKSLYDLATLASTGRMMVRDMATVTAAMMRAHGRAQPEDPLKSSYLGAKAENVAPLIYEAGPPRIQIRLAILLAGALTGGYTSSGEAKTSEVK